MITVVPFKAEHFEALMERGNNTYLKEYVTPARLAALEASSYSFTGLAAGRPVVAAGVANFCEYRAEAWAVFDPDCKTEFLSIHRAVERFLDLCPIVRIEATVDCEFQEGHRWAKALGFKLEAERMRHYRPNGLDSALYARVKGRD